ncbi:MAG TPA: hypothetical protein VFK20_14440 [Vicinamibacterales bacterium]|nr:hypothetical protein [Vicinamibacterales bacterium]
MTKQTRYFMAGSAAVIVAGLGVGLAAYYTGGFPSLSASRTGPAELAYVPADSPVVAYANVREVMNSSLRQQFKQSMPDRTDEGQREFQQRTGIDIERDIDYVVAAMAGPETQGEHDPNGLVVARGRFNTGLLETLARDHGGVVEEYKGKRLVTVSERRQDSGTPDDTDRRHHGAITLAFLEPGLVGIGSQAAIKSAIDAQLTAHSITSNDAMMELVSDIESGNNAWAVGRFDAIANQTHLPDEIRSRIPAVKTFAVMSHIDGGLTGTLRAETRDEQSAENLRQVVQGFLALGRMQAQSDPKVAAMLQSLQLSGSGTTVALSFAVPAEVFSLMGQAHRNGNQR